jgi:pimeloyl-ACP methyl ester carboxylesterase
VARFVLVHGAWLGGWTWAPLARELESRGHEVRAPDLPCEDVSAGIDEYAELIGPQLDAVVVGHSLAGLTLPLVEARTAVFLSALLPVPDVYKVALAPGFRTGHRDDQGRSFWADEESAAERLYPDVDAGTQRWAFPQLRRQVPLTSHERLPDGPRASIVTLRDVAVRPEWQAEAARDVLGVEPIELDTGHFPMLTHPAGLADLLERFA